jgi:hypothetical protein
MDNKTDRIDHETVFIPYYSKSKSSELDNQANSLITLLGR